MNKDIDAIGAQAELHHQYFLGLQLMVAVEESRQVVYDWMFRLFRRQHEEKFLSSFAKLGLDGLPHAVACAKYHVLSNGVGGVAVEYMAETDTKAWVRFRYPAGSTRARRFAVFPWKPAEVLRRLVCAKWCQLE